MKSRLLFAVVIAAAACGPKAGREVIPRLPGDGTANVEPPAETEPPAPAKDPWSNRADLIAAPAPRTPAPIRLPLVERFTLANGLPVLVIRDNRLPTMAMQLMVRAGRADEPLARLGVAELVANTLPKGTRKKNALQIATAIDQVGGSITADAGFESTWVTCAVLSKDSRTCVDLMSEMVTQPSFADAELDKARALLLADVSRRLDDTAALADAHALNLLWGDEHVRGWVTSARSIGALRRDDAVAWHKTWFVPGNAVLAVTGDVDTAKLKADLIRAFAGWKKAPVPARARYIDPPESPRLRLVDKPGLTQTQIRVAQLGIRHDDPRFFATVVWNDVLGAGGFNSRLMKVVRVEGGKSYGARSGFDRDLERGALVAQTFTRTEETLATLELVIGELARMAKDGPTDAEVADAITHVAGSYALRMTGADDVARALITADLHGLAERYVSHFPALTAEVTRDEAAAAAAAILTPDRLAVVLVGDGAKLAPMLDAAGVTYERVAWTDTIGADPERPKLDPKQIAAAAKVLELAIAAKGERSLAVKSLRMTAAGTLAAQGQTLNVEFARTLVVPDRMRMDIRLNQQFEVTIAVKGDAGWQSGPGGIDDLPADQLPALEQQRFVDSERVLVHARAKDVVAALVGTDKVDGAPCDAIHIQAKSGLEAVLCFDQKTHLLAMTRYPNGGGETRETYGDYRAVDGIQVAHRRKSVSSGESSELVVQKVEFDPVVDPAIFEKP